MPLTVSYVQISAVLKCESKKKNYVLQSVTYSAFHVNLPEWQGAGGLTAQGLGSLTH